MAFDAKQAIADKITHLEDSLKQAKVKQERDAQENALAIAVLEEELDAWVGVLGGKPKTDSPQPPKRAAARAESESR